MLPDSKVVDAPPHGVSIADTVAMAGDFEFLVLFTSTPGFEVDVKIAERMRDKNPKLKIAFVGPPVTIESRLTGRVVGAIGGQSEKECQQGSCFHRSSRMTSRAW
jgi:hypothetical protein